MDYPLTEKTPLPPLRGFDRGLLKWFHHRRCQSRSCYKWRHLTYLRRTQSRWRCQLIDSCCPLTSVVRELEIYEHVLMASEPEGSKNLWRLSEENVSISLSVSVDGSIMSGQRCKHQSVRHSAVPPSMDRR